MSTVAASSGGLAKTVPKVTLTRRYRFAASHRMYSPAFSEQENRNIYGKCSNPYGHGHNYVLEVTIGGSLDPATGMIANLGDLDPFVQKQVLDAFEYRNLNEEVPEFKTLVPTTENITRVIFERLRAFPVARLMRVRIEETSNNSFEYSG